MALLALWGIGSQAVTILAAHNFSHPLLHRIIISSVQLCTIVACFHSWNIAIHVLEILRRQENAQACGTRIGSRVIWFE
jgi:EamA domain-containing membrane protein RarD